LCTCYFILYTLVQAILMTTSYLDSATFPQLLVEGIVRSIQESDLYKLFNKFGRVKHVGTVVGKSDQAIITLGSDDAVQRVMRVGKLSCRGRKLSVTLLGEQHSPCEQTQLEFPGTREGHGQPVECKVRLRRKFDKTNGSKIHDMRGSNSYNRAESQETQCVPNFGRKSFNTRLSSQTVQLHSEDTAKTFKDLRKKNFRTSPDMSETAVTHYPVKPSTPVYFRQFPTTNTSNIHQAPWPESPPNLIHFPCFSFQPLPLVFPIYHMDTFFYLSMNPLVPNYCIQPSR